MTTTPDQIVTFIREYRAGSTFSDPNLSGPGVAAKRKELTDAAVAKVRGPINTNATVATAKAEKVRADALSGLRARGADAAILQDIARQKVEVLLKSGRDLARIIETTTDVTTLAAIIEWGPTWVQAAKPYPTDALLRSTFQEPETAWIADAVLGRLPKVDPSSPSAKVGAATDDADKAALWGDVVTALVVGDMKPGTGSAETWSALYESDRVAYDVIQGALSAA